MQELKADGMIMGVALTISTLAELPALFFANYLLRRYKAGGLLLLGVVFTGVRLLLYAAFPGIVEVLIVQLLQGLTFPLIWVAGVSYADERATPGMEATAQGLFSVTVFGFGSAAGGLLGGLLLSSLGGRGMYLVFGVLVLASTFVIALLARRSPVEKHG
jgi:MFS family permease